mmetsp:Transcript_1479/g.4402  ORF Transcript_1479/g.4402 Transcript_1479/m.4402 type:complete len:249 (+) Transcript_1479:209-955(+)
MSHRLRRLGVVEQRHRHVVQERVVEAVDKELGVPAQEVRALCVVFRDLLYPFCAHLDDLRAGGPGEEGPVEGRARGPQGRLARPLALADGHGLVAAGAVVLQRALDHEDELLNHLPVHYGMVSYSQRNLAHSRRAEVVDDVGVEVEVLAEEGVVREHRHVDLLAQVLLDRLWQHPQQGNVVRLHSPLPQGRRVVLPHAPPDAAGELVRDLVGRQEDADLALARHPRRVDVADVRHCLRDAADEGGEYH